ncbi:MAG: carboxylesterase/lipase family protein [Byssovorax sp.]
MRAFALFSGIVPLTLLVAACGSDPGGTGGSGSTGTGTGTGTGGGGDGTLVATDKGSVQGTIVGTTRIFLGIPYAAPPIGDLRWKPPAPAAAWKDTLVAKTRGAYCAQLNALSPVIAAGSQEDCLTLNVWAPVGASGKTPVMVWIHGGSFIFGSGGEPTYDGRRLSEATGAIIVTINYRLGPFGFLAHDDLAVEDQAHPSTGMYGIEDQRAALQWTKANVGAFGGDPGRVTLFGESAGGESVCLHTLSPKSQGLFNRAIIESGACAATSGITPIEAKAQGDAFAKALTCDGKDGPGTLSCLRGKSMSEVLMALPSKGALDFSPGGSKWFPSVDGYNIPKEPLDLLNAGSFSPVPLLVGSNGDEGTLFFAFGGTTIPDDAAYKAAVESFYPGKGDAILAHYPSATYGSPQAAVARAFGDSVFVCPSRRLARAFSKAGAPTYLYHFTYKNPNAALPNLGAFHSSELPFIFGNPSELLPENLTAEQRKLSDLMMSYWGELAKTGEPAGDGPLRFPDYDLAHDESMRLDLMVSKESGLAKADCDFWDAL